MIDVRDNWRVVMLVVFCFIAALALFGPLGAGDGSGSGLNESEQISDPTNLQYGLDLSGGARVRGQLVGLTAENVEGLSSRDQVRDVETTVAGELGLEVIAVTARVPTQQGQTSTVEVFSSNVTQQEFADALGSAGLDVSTGQIRSGTTEATRDRAVDTLVNRVDQTGLSGANVRTVNQAGGGYFIEVEVPGADRQEVRELIGRPGQVQIIAGFPPSQTDDDDEIRTLDDGTEVGWVPLLTQEDLSKIQSARSNAQSGPNVPITLTQDAAETYSERVQRYGFTREGQGQCNYEEGDTPSPSQWCLYTVVDGNITSGVAMGPLANSINQGTFVNDPSFIVTTSSIEEAEDLEDDLRAGSLPTELRIESEDFISPSLAQKFKPLSLLTGILAWLTVAGVVYFWYRDVRVAIPMVVTASTEVFLLLGFAAGFGMALNLSHIAGLIAVIGTGLDDLIIMADEILQRQEKVQTGRVFQSRFRKAFWVIGMAAATTIIAMSPLAVLSLGELRGFAIITIIGVLIGVAVTRPAYGDVLRKLMLDDVSRN
jgi:preprotein translocase subunit SecD